MAIVINGSGTVTGLAVGGLPDGTVDDGTVASGIASSKLTGALPAISGASLTGFTDAQMPAGSVLQVVQITSVVQSTSTSGSDVDLFTAAITPSSTSSKILVNTTIFHGRGNDETFYMSRNGTKIAGVGSGGTQYISVGSFYNSDNSVAGDTATMASLSYQYLDSPSSTSAVTYKIGHMSPSSPTFYINRAATAGQGFGRSTLTLTEIKG